MSSLSLQNLAPAAQRAHIMEVMRRRWVRPAPPMARYRVPAAEVDALARAVLDAMLTRPFRIGPLPSDAEYAWLLTCVGHWIRRGRPVQVTLGYAPLKNLNTAPASRADWAEFC